LNVLLANPPCRIGINETEEFAFVRAGSRWPFSSRKKKDERLSYVPFPFFMSYAAALLEKNGFTVSVIDAVPLNLTEEEFISEAYKRSPDLVMIETSTPTVQSDIELAQKLKEKCQAKIAFAGPHVSVMPKETMEQAGHIDFVMIGEYELTLLNLAMSIRDKASQGSIAGLAFRSDSKVHVNNAKSIIEPLDMLPFPGRHLFPIDTCENQDVYWDGFCQYKPAIQINSSRGCPFSCSFCVWTQTMYPPHKVRTFSAKRVVDEMEYLIGRYGAKEIYFDDDTFTARKQHVLSICKELKDRDLSTYGFLGYPLLQTADIIIYRARYVPVGVDQVPHLEISREIARRFNNLYKEVFPEPEALLTEFPKVPGVDGRKMSKSYDNAIYLSDSPKVAEQKILTMMTDPARKRRTDIGNPELSPVFQLHKIFSSKQEQDEVAEGCRTAGIGCIECKKILIKNIFRVLEPIWQKRSELIANPKLVMEAAEKGTDKARKVAEETMQFVREAMGLG